MVTSASAPRYDRIISLVFVILIGLVVIFLVDGNPNTLRIVLGGDLPVITLSWFLVGSLVVITCAGADLLARAHPVLQTQTLPLINLGLFRLEVAPAFWVLPSFSLIGSFAFFRLFSNSLQGLAFVLALVAAGGSMIAVLIAQHYALDRRTEVRQRAHTALQLIGYVLAFFCFSAIYYTRYRTLYSASMVGLCAGLISYGMLAIGQQPGRVLLSALVGLVLTEATWALNYWATTYLLAGTLLLVLFYVTVSLLHHHLAGRLQMRLIWEYGLLGGGLFLAIVYATVFR